MRRALAVLVVAMSLLLGSVASAQEKSSLGIKLGETRGRQVKATSVDPGSEAWGLGLRTDDTIRTINGEAVESTAGCRKALEKLVTDRANFTIVVVRFSRESGQAMEKTLQGKAGK